MKHPAIRTAAIAVAAAIALTLTACSSGGGGDDSPDPVDLLLNPSIVRLKRIVERSDSLITPGLHISYSISVGDADELEEETFQNAECTGANCTIDNADPADMDGSMVALQDLIDLTVDLGPADVILGVSGGFDTIVIESDLNVSNQILPNAVNVDPPTVSSMGLWGEHGFAGVAIGKGPLTGDLEVPSLSGTLPFQGRLNLAMAFSMGDTTGRDPTGLGNATWEGIVEAASTRTFERRSGTVQILMADLSQPRASVDIEVDGFRVGPTEWSNLMLDGAGGFSHGTVADGNFLQGDFHGPAHEEAYGVFDTQNYTGAFGAKQSN